MDISVSETMDQKTYLRKFREGASSPLPSPLIPPMIVRGQCEAVCISMHKYQTFNFCFQLLRQKIASAYNVAAVCCNSHVPENILSSNRFTSIQVKTISWLSEFRVSFWQPKTA